MRIVLLAVVLSALVGCTFGVKTCSPSDPCAGGGQCVQGVCAISLGGGDDGGLDAGTEAGTDAGADDSDAGDAGFDAGLGGGAGGGTGGGTGGGSGGGTGGGAGGGGGGGGAFDAGPLEGIVFLTPPRVVRAGECSEEIQVGVFEDGGAGSLFLVSPNEEATFYADSNCGLSPVLELPIPTSNVVSLYFRSSVAGSVLVNAALSLETAGTAQVERVIGGLPAQLAFGAPLSVPAGQCSSPLAVQVRDSFGNVTAVSATLEVALSSSSATTQFYAGDDATCGTPLVPAAIALIAGESGTSFRFRDAVPGSPTFEAAAPDGGAEGPAPASREQEIF